jgi:hypothetical protein
MLDLAEGGAPLEVPSWIHLVLWPALIVWAAALRSARRGHRLLGSAGLGFALSVLCLAADGATLAAAVTWSTPDADSFVFALLWLAALLSISAYLVLRAPHDDDDGGSEAEPPEPPWWPQFEREFRDYTRAGPKIPAGRTRPPVGAR